MAGGLHVRVTVVEVNDATARFSGAEGSAPVPAAVETLASVVEFGLVPAGFVAVTMKSYVDAGLRPVTVWLSEVVDGPATTNDPDPVGVLAST